MITLISIIAYLLIGIIYAANEISIYDRKVDEMFKRGFIDYHYKESLKSPSVKRTAFIITSLLWLPDLLKKLLNKLFSKGV